jgi:hypothetical protein
VKKVILIFVIGLFFSCNKKQTANNVPILKSYIISEEDRKLKENTDSLNRFGNKAIYLPRKGFYGESNLIIDKKGEIYYFQKRYFMLFCDYGMENDTLPEFLDLQPKDLIKIPKEALKRFVDENVMNREKRRQILVIASQNDTIKDITSLKFLRNTRVPTYFIRRTTQEEDTVLQYKKTKIYYYSDSIKWDKTKIKFKN